MPQTDITAALHSPAMWIGFGVVAVALVCVLLREVRKIPVQLLVLMATAFMDMVGLLMVVPLLPYYVQRLGGGGVIVLGITLKIGVLSGVVASSFTAAQLISAPYWGRFSDRFGRRPTLLIALGASGIAFLVFAFADSLVLLVLARLVQGAGGGTVGVIQAYVADSTPPEQRARALGWLSAATNLGVTLGPALSLFAMAISHAKDEGGATSTMALATPSLIAAALCLVNMVFAARWLTESNERRGTESRSTSLGAVGLVLTRIREAPSRLLLIYALNIGAAQGISQVLILFLDHRFGVKADSAGWLFTYMGAIAVFARAMLLGPLLDRLGEARLSRLGIVVLACGLGLLPFTGSLATLAVAVGLLPLGNAFTFPCVTALLSRVVEARDRGLYLGLQQTFGGVARISAPLLFGWAYDEIGKPVPFLSGAGVVLATLALGFGLGQLSRPKPAA